MSVQLLAPQIVSGPPNFVTVSNVLPSSTNQAFTVRFTTDQAVICNIQWWSLDDPSITTITTIVDAGATTTHVFTTANMGAGHAGKHFAFQINIDPTDTSGLTLRPYIGTVQLIGARAGTPLAVPVRFYMFGGTPPAPPSGGGTGSPPAGPAAGNWNQYTWAQYNPKGSVFPAP